MAKQKFQISGVGAIATALNTLEAKLAKKIIRSEIRKAMKPIQAEVKSQAPVMTGQTKRAVKVRAMKRKKGRVGVTVQIGKGDYKGDQYYAAFVEYGTSKMAPNPFMRRSFDAKAPAAKEQVEAGILARVDEEVRKLKAATS